MKSQLQRMTSISLTLWLLKNFLYFFPSDEYGYIPSPPLDNIQVMVSAQHQSHNQWAALADCLTDVDGVISTHLIWHKTCNLAGVGFHQIVEI